jgi:ribonucleoside-diphosphate reductase alpha chain
MATAKEAPQVSEALEEYVNTVVDSEASVAPQRYFTIPGRDPFDEVEWELRHALIPGKDGPAFEQKDVEFPRFWSQTATNIVAQKYFRGRMTSPERERSVKQMIGRIVETIGTWGRSGGYFATDDEADTFEAELKAILVNQIAAFNSPVWFNVGFEEKPQCSACFILSIEDSMESILDWIRREGIIFRGGSGSGLNLSRLRSSKEQLSKGGYASGPVSFMRGADASAGTIKSGGKTRRAAKMVVLDVDHPDVDEFIWCKAKEERKARVLEQAGYDMSLDSPDWGSIQYQNANNSVRVTDAFMEAVVEGKEWNLTARTDGSVVETVDARALLKDIAEASWQCADPGVQYDTTINAWHTSPNSGRINASNPCSEYMHVDDSACNLASLNLMKFRKDDGEFDVDMFEHAVDVVFLAQEIIVGYSSYPTPEIGRNALKFRQLGLGYANLGALLMALGMPYDSEAGRSWAAAITALMTGRAYRTSGDVAAAIGPYDESLTYEDWDMWLRVSEHYQFAYFPRPTAKYRIVQNSMSKASVDKMTLANELMFIKYLLQKRVPKQVRNQAFNFAVRRAYRQRATAPAEAKHLLNTMVWLYKSPRLVYAWMLYVLGFEYRHYEEAIKAVKRITQFAR